MLNLPISFQHCEWGKRSVPAPVSGSLAMASCGRVCLLMGPYPSCPLPPSPHVHTSPLAVTAAVNRCPHDTACSQEAAGRKRKEIGTCGIKSWGRFICHPGRDRCWVDPDTHVSHLQLALEEGGEQLGEKLNGGQSVVLLPTEALAGQTQLPALTKAYCAYMYVSVHDPPLDVIKRKPPVALQAPLSYTSATARVPHPS